MPVKKKPSAAQLAARAKFVKMVRAKAAPKKSAKKVAGLDKVTRKGKKTMVHYSRLSGVNPLNTKTKSYKENIKNLSLFISLVSSLGLYKTSGTKKAKLMWVEDSIKAEKLLQKIDENNLTALYKSNFANAKSAFNYWKA